MKISELIEILKDLDPERYVYFLDSEHGHEVPVITGGVANATICDDYALSISEDIILH